MPIVTLKEALEKAEKGKYALGMFNVLNTETILSVMKAAEENHSPVILSLPEVDWWFLDFRSTAQAMVDKAKASSVPVVLHYDHGHNLEHMQTLLDLGWTSLMIDESARPLEDNIAITRSVVEMARPYGASVEGELGHIGGGEGQQEAELESAQDSYTQLAEAQYFVEQTGIDALAVAIGTAHGEYRFTPRLDFQRLEELYRGLDVPLVLHGGSGLTADDFRRCIQLGIRKINVFTEVMLEPGKYIKERLEKEPGWKMHYTDLMALSIHTMTESIKRNMDIFQSSGKA